MILGFARFDHEICISFSFLFRISSSELEVDAVAMDILNTNELAANAMNPGLKVNINFFNDS